MFYSLTPSGVVIVQKERPRSKIDNGRASDAHGINLGCREPSADTAGQRYAPNNAAIERVERVHIIHFGYGNDRCSATWTIIE